LIELLVVIAIIGILAAVAIPQFAAYRRKGYDADVQTNARNMATAQEAYFVDNNAYTSSVADLLNFGYSQSANVTPSIPTANSTTFVVEAAVASGCSAGTGVARYDQATGQITLTKCAP
jgi:type II secretory pathway pseudopilin PulG